VSAAEEIRRATQALREAQEILERVRGDVPRWWDRRGRQDPHRVAADNAWECVRSALLWTGLAQRQEALLVRGKGGAR
jgi:hypothetical protein